MHTSIRRAFQAAATSLIFTLAACGSSGSPSPAPAPTATPTPPARLYVGDNSSPSQVKAFTLPATASSTPAVTFASGPANVMGVASNASSVALTATSGTVAVYAQPFTAASVATATFSLGAPAYQAAFNAAGQLVVATGSQVDFITPPFTNASVPSSHVTLAAAADGIAYDSAGTLYAGTQGTTIYTIVSGAIGVTVTGPANHNYRGLAASGSNLIAIWVGVGTSGVDVYALPLTSASAPVASISNGINSPEGAAADSSGNVYVGNLGNATVTVYAPPFTAASAPTATLPVTGSTIFGLGVGP